VLPSTRCSDLRAAVDRLHAHAGAQRDALARQHLGRTHHQLRGVDLAGQPGLGQRRAVVGAVGSSPSSVMAPV
jgi:hypothetical protein